MLDSLPLTRKFFLYEQGWADGHILVRTDKEVSEDKLEGLSLAISKSEEDPPRKHFNRLKGDDHEKQLWGEIELHRKIGRVGWDNKPWDLELQIRKDPSEFKRTREFEGVRFWVIDRSPSSC